MQVCLLSGAEVFDSKSKVTLKRVIIGVTLYFLALSPALLGTYLEPHFPLLTLIQPQGPAWICTKVTEGIWLQGLRVMWLSVRNWCAGLSHHLRTWPVTQHLPLPAPTPLVWRRTRQEGNRKGGVRGGVRVSGGQFEQKAVILNYLACMVFTRSREEFV